MHAPTESTINWQLGLRGLLLSMTLAGVSGASGSRLPMLAAIIVGAWTAIRPLRGVQWLLQPSTVRMVVSLMARICTVTVAAALLSLAVNSGSPLLNVPGTLLFLALAAGVAATAARYAWQRSRVLLPRLWASWLETASTLRTHVGAALGASRQP